MSVKHLSHKKRGIVAVLVAVSLIAILGIAALAIDAGKLLDDDRRLQAAADAAALAAADDLFTNYYANGGADPNGTAAAMPLSTAAADGYNNNGTTNTVTVNIPPTSGIAVGKNRLCRGNHHSQRDPQLQQYLRRRRRCRSRPAPSPWAVPAISAS